MKRFYFIIDTTVDSERIKMTIFEAKGRITPFNDKTNLIHRFDVPQGIKLLRIKYEYSPKILEDKEKAIGIIRSSFQKYDEKPDGSPDEYLPVKNLVTLSVDGPDGYIGAAHRQADKQEHIISPDFSSCGFIKTPVEAGEWDIVLNVHSVSCDVDYCIKVEGEAK